MSLLSWLLCHTISRHGNVNPMLPIYLFIIGELVNAYHYISHIECVRMVLCMRFFKSIWKTFLQVSGYQENQYFILMDTDDIIDILIDGLLARWFYLHSSLATGITSQCVSLSHLGCMEAKPINMSLACFDLSFLTDFWNTAAVYSHTYFNANDIPIGVLSQFLSDDEIAKAAIIAYNEANKLRDLLGYYPNGGKSSTMPSHMAGGQVVPNSHEDANNLDELEDSTSHAFDCCAL